MMTALGIDLRRAAARLTPDPAPDGELLARFLATRDEAAFALLVRRHAGMVFGTCRRVLGNATDADDAFQAAFVVLVRKAHSLTNRTCVGNFLYGVAFHTALKARAMATKRRAKEVKATRSESTDSGELTRVLDEELAKLPDKYREPVVLCELEGVSRKDAAARLSIPEGTISSRLATAHRMLAKRLTARGFAAAAVAMVLGDQSFAVPEVLTAAAVRAAADGPPAAVTQLASEVSKMLLWNKLKAGVVLAAVLLTCGLGVGVMAKGFAADNKPIVKAPAPVKADAKKDEDLIQGLWQAERLEWGGQNAPAALEEKFQVRFKGNAITFVADGRTHTFELDATAKPKAMNLTPGDGSAKGKKLECAIYELDGETLTICMDKDGEAGKRPAEFKTAPKDGLALIVLKRVKEEKKDKDEEQIQGMWEAETVRIRGKQVSADTVYKVMRWKFHDTTLTMTTEDGEGSVVFELDATATPKTLTTFKAGAKKKAPHAIYELDGDTLKVCHNTEEGDAGPIPTSFRAGPNDKDELIVFKRVKEPAKKPENPLLGKWEMMPSSGKYSTFWEVTADTLTLRSDNPKSEPNVFTYELVADKSPAELILKEKSFKTVNRYVFKIDGDTLTAARDAQDDAPTPKGFTAKEVGDEAFKTLRVFSFKRVKAEDEKLIGKWKQTGRVIGGEAITDPQGWVIHWDITKDELVHTTTNPKKEAYLQSYTVAAHRTPAVLTTRQGNAEPQQYAYRIDGDTLKVAHFVDLARVAPQTNPPAGFTAKELGDKAFKCLVVDTFERVKPKKDDKKLLGKWKQSDMSAGGVKVDLGKGERHWIIGEDQIQSTTTNPLKHGTTLRYTADSGRSPAELTTTNEQAEKRHSIYMLDGDTLTVAFYIDTDPKNPPAAPKGFTAKEVGDEAFKTLYVVTYERVKDDKKPDADKGYSLKDGEVLKLIPAPFSNERDDIYAKFDAAGGIKPTPPAVEHLMAVWVKGGQPSGANAFTNRKSSGAEKSGQPLGLFVQYALRIDRSTVLDPDGLLDSTILDADVVLNRTTAPAELVAALKKELQAKAGIDLALELREVETSVVVIGGKHTLKVDPPADPTRVYDNAPIIHLFAVDKQEHPNGHMCDTTAFATQLAAFLGRPVIDESDFKKANLPITVRFHNRYPETADTRAADRDPTKVLKNLEAQTGLTFKQEKRKVKALVVEKANSDPKVGRGDKNPPAWKAEFDELYTLKAGEVVRYVPLSDDSVKLRETYHDEVIARGEKGMTLDAGTVLWFTFDKGEAKWYIVGGGANRGPGKIGAPLEHVISAAFVYGTAPELDLDPKLAGIYLPGDWIVRSGATTKERVKGLQEALAAHAPVGVKLELKEVEREVLVASGEWKFAPREWRNDAVEVYALEKVVDKKLSPDGTYLKGVGDLSNFLKQAGGFCDRRLVVGDVKNLPKALKWYLHERNSEKIAEQQEDHDADAILKNLSEQTGLTFKAETRKVPVLVVTKQ